MIRIAGHGLVVQEHTKSDAGMRTIVPPRWMVDLLRRRHVTSFGNWAFPSSVGSSATPTPPGRSSDRPRGTRWEGSHPHVFRHVVATRLDTAGLSAREIADYLGHERPSMTQDVYMTRTVRGTGAGAALDGFDPDL